MLDAFAPHQKLAATLLPHSFEGDDGAHDIAHLCRVWKSAARIHSAEGGDIQVILAAVLLHDCVAVEKNSPLRSQASRLAAAKARTVLAGLGWTAGLIEQVAHTIEAHSFSAAIPPRTLEARIMQDADRLDAIGMVGVARCFYTAGRMGSKLYDAADPTAERRPLDDTAFAIDHFHAKLLKLVDGFQTGEGGRMARERQKKLQVFLDDFMDEV